MKYPKRKKLYYPTFPQAATFFFIATLLWGSVWLVEGFYPATTHCDTDAPISLYANQVHDDLQKVILTAIHSSKSSILLIIYSLSDKAVINALRTKSEEGVKVKVICDAKASPYAVKRLGPGIEVLRRFSPGHMHQKILVVDEERVWIGSANMTGESLTMHANLITAIQCPQLAAAIFEKSTGLSEYGIALPLLPQKYVVNGQQLEICFFPDDIHGVKRLNELIKAAQKTIRVAMFTWTRYDLARAVVSAKKRGVDVQVVIDRNSANGVGGEVISILSKEGVQVGLSQGRSLFHHKFLYIDEKILVNGSANWTRAAFTKNDDCFIILQDLTLEQQRKMNALWEAIVQDSATFRE